MFTVSGDLLSAIIMRHQMNIEQWRRAQESDNDDG